MLSDLKKGFKTTIDYLGTSALFKTKTIKLGFKTAGVKDEEIVNTYGVGAKILTIDIDTITVIPKKFDYIHIDSHKFVFEAVQPIYLGAEHVGYKIIVKGK